MASIACQSLPGQDVLLSASRDGDELCWRCYVLRTDTHEAAISEPTCAPYRVLDVLPAMTTAEPWIEMPPPPVVPVPEVGGTLILFAGVLALAWMGRKRNGSR